MYADIACRRNKYGLPLGSCRTSISGKPKTGMPCRLETALMKASLAQKIPVSEALATFLLPQYSSSPLLKTDRLCPTDGFLLNSRIDCMSYPISIIGGEGCEIGTFQLRS